MFKLLIVGAGGFVGAIGRYALCWAVQRGPGATFPMGTLTVNVIGCLFIGMAMALVEGRPLLSANARLFVVMGLLGSFTTFSTFSYQTVELLRGGQWQQGLFSVAGNVLLGAGAVILGRLSMRAVGM